MGMGPLRKSKMATDQGNPREITAGVRNVNIVWTVLMTKRATQVS